LLFAGGDTLLLACVNVAIVGETCRLAILSCCDAPRLLWLAVSQHLPYIPGQFSVFVWHSNLRQLRTRTPACRVDPMVALQHH
jgi:hypothetical protein